MSGLWRNLSFESRSQILSGMTVQRGAIRVTFHHSSGEYDVAPFVEVTGRGNVYRDSTSARVQEELFCMDMQRAYEDAKTSIMRLRRQYPDIKVKDL